MASLPFIEAYTIPRIATSITGTLDTRPIDQYRQGIELTKAEYFTNSPVKIYSGLANHQFILTEYGNREVPLSDDGYYSEVDIFDPVTYVRLQSVASNQYVFFSELRSRGFGLPQDGVIEALAIRDVVDFASLYGGYEAHAIRGFVNGGNVNLIYGSDQAVQFLRFAEERNAVDFFEDNVDTIGNLPTNIGFFNTPTKPLLPFDDTRFPSGIRYSSNLPQNMIDAALALDPETEEYHSYGYVGTSGFVYETSPGHYDSLAFGDLKY